MTDPRQPRTPAPTPADAQRQCPVRYLTIEELSAATTLSVSTLRRLKKKGVIIGHQPGGPRHRVVFTPNALEQAADAQKPGGAASDQKAPPSGGTTRPQRGPRPKWARGS